ncbi:MAG: mandelate racemase/muconate lactonizing enzyme family protein [Methyloligellaceae bacterium]
MTIQKIHIHPYVQSLPETLRNARKRPLKKEMLIVSVELSSGVKGHGECWTAGIGFEAIAHTIQSDLSSDLKHLPPAEARKYLRNCLSEAIKNDDESLAAAVSGLDCACWDAEANAAGIPLYELLGGKHREIYCYASGGLYDDKKGIRDLEAEVCRHTDQKFDAVKIKVAGLPLEEDVARVQATRKAIGPDVKLMVDANTVYSATEAQAFAKAIDDQDIYWFEEPCPETELAELRTNCNLPICGYERAVGQKQFGELIEPGHLDFVQIDLSICGGITEAIDIVKIAGSLPVTLHGASSVVLFMANLQFAAAFRQIESIEYHKIHQWPVEGIRAPDIGTSPGLVVPSREAGIGVALPTT